jgi:hypothetical protein
MRLLLVALTLTVEPSSPADRRALDRAWQEVELGAVILSEAVKARPTIAAAQLADGPPFAETPVDAGAQVDLDHEGGR